MKKILITGVVGFIGSNIAEKLLKMDNHIFGIDNFSNQYPTSVYQSNLALLNKYKRFQFSKINILNVTQIFKLIDEKKPDYLVHCAAKTGIKNSLNQPTFYYKTNVLGTQNILEAVRLYSPRTKLILLSSSSVYGKQNRMPFTEDIKPNPISPYGLSKYLMEESGRFYFEKYGLSIIIIRPFSIYGPRGRLDMAPMIAIKAAVKGIPFTKFGSNDDNQRDWTYIDDFVNGINNIVKYYKFSSFEIFNFGNNKPIGITEFVSITKKSIKLYLNKNLIINKKPRRNFEMSITCADIKKAQKNLNFCPKFSFKTGFETLLKNYLLSR